MRPNDAVLVFGSGEYFRFGLPGYSTGTALRFEPGPVPKWSVQVQSPVVSGVPCWDPRAHFDAPTRRLVTWNAEGLWTREVAGSAPWQVHASAATAPPQTPNAMSAIDTRRRRLLVFGGADHLQSVTADRLWSCPLDGPAEWTSVSIDGTPPSGTSGTQCAYDPARDRLVVLPSTSFASFTNPMLDTVQVLELSGEAPSWIQLPTEGAPPVRRADATVVLDAVHDRIVLAGGVIVGGDGRHPRDVWTLSLGEHARWKELLPGVRREGPHARAALVIDRTLDRLLLIGGVGLAFFDFGNSNTIRTAPLDDPTGWSALDPASSSPLRGAGTAVLDAAADRVLWWNGATLWELAWPLGTPSTFGPATVVLRDRGVYVRWPAAVTEPYAARIERSAEGGRAWSVLLSVTPAPDGSIAFTDTVPPASATLAYRAVVERGGVLRVLGTASLTQIITPPVSFALAPPRPNPASGDVVLELASPSDADITIELFDLAGRQLGATVHRRVLAGREAFAFPLARGLAPGLYLLRATDGRTSRQRRLAVIR